VIDISVTEAIMAELDAIRTSQTLTAWMVGFSILLAVLALLRR
jgi:hypothetical protein